MEAVKKYRSGPPSVQVRARLTWSEQFAARIRDDFRGVLLVARSEYNILDDPNATDEIWRQAQDQQRQGEARGPPAEQWIR